MNSEQLLELLMKQVVEMVPRPDEFPSLVSDSTVFLVKGDKVMATAFVIGVRDNESGTARRLYLVTARHNLERAGSNTILKARHNLKTNTFIDCEYNTDNFLQHPTTDIAIHPLQLFPKLKSANIPMESLTNWGLDDYLMARKDEIDEGFIKWGSHVVVPSMFHLHTGNDIMQPIHRFGRIAMIPQEQVEVEIGYCRQKIDAILIETMVWPGASGAPVFTNRNGVGRSSCDKIPLRLLGLISSHFETLTENKTPQGISKLTEKIKQSQVQVDTSASSESMSEESAKHDGKIEAFPEKTKIHINTGISVVIPAYQIRDFVLKIHEESGGWMPENPNFWELR